MTTPDRLDAKEELKEELKPGIRALLGQLQQTGGLPHPQVNLTTIVSDTISLVTNNSAVPVPVPTGNSTISSSSVNNNSMVATGSTGGIASFFPDLDATAAAALRMIGGNTEIVIVPGSVDMQPGNSAITIKSGDQIENYRGQIGAAAAKMQGVDATAVKARVQIDTILIKEGLMRAGGLDMRGNIWHEYGHVLYGAAESGSVFAHEVNAIAAQFSKDTARQWVLEKRTLNYFAATPPRLASVIWKTH